MKQITTIDTNRCIHENMKNRKRKPKKEAALQKAASMQPIQSHYDLLRGRFTFSNEPNWMRLVVSVIFLIGVIIVLLSFRHHLPALLGIRWLSNAPWIKAIARWRSRSP